MAVNIEDIKQLRAQTSASMGDVKAALESSDGSYDKALKFLYEKGLTSATKRMDRETNQGVIYSYVHSNRIGVLVELNCETDFVSRNVEFVELAKELCVQIVLNDPKYIDETDLSEDEKKDAKNLVLLKQAFYKETSITVEDHIKQHIAKFGENIKVSRFYKMILGQ